MQIRRVIDCLVCLGAAVLLTGCLRALDTQHPTNLNATPLPSSTIAPITPTEERQSSHETTVATSKVSAGMLAETLAADPSYMIDCKAANPSRHTGQVDYRGVLPGQSTPHHVKALLGNPADVQNTYGREAWIYAGFNITFDGGVVRSIDVYDDPAIMVALDELASKHGCPDVIFAIDMSVDQPSGAYGLTEFAYLRNGIRFRFADFPVPLSSKPYSVDFIKPQPLESYLEESDYFHDTLEVATPVSWKEAVR